MAGSRFRILLVEDEDLAADRLRNLIQQSEGEEIEISRTSSVKESILWLSKNTHPNLVFMDVELGDGLCFEIFEVIELRAPIIFTTAYDQYAIQAFKVNSIDYLLKPIDSEELAAALGKLRSLKQGSAMSHKPDIGQLAELIAHPYKQQFVIKVGEHLKMLPTSGIVLFYSESKSSFAFSKEKRNLPLEFSLDRLEEMLDPAEFFRINRKQIIHFAFIDDIISYSKSRLKVLLTGGVEGIVSRERVGDFKEWLDR